MNTSPRLMPSPRVTRQYQPSRLQDQSLIGAYERVIPIVARRRAAATHCPCDPRRAAVRVGPSRSSAAGA
jgi:hypothetical protein